MLYFDAMITLKLTPTNYLVVKSYDKQKYGIKDMIMIYSLLLPTVHIIIVQTYNQILYHYWFNAKLFFYSAVFSQQGYQEISASSLWPIFSFQIHL